jgi:cytoskeletal protein CcmA (bactofilin family)
MASGAGTRARFRHEIESDVSISGRIHFPDDARIDGQLRGEVRADALLVIGETARLEAAVSARRLLVYGRLCGDVLRSGTVELHPGSSVQCDIESQSLVVHEGARFEGHAWVGTPARRARTSDRSGPPPHHATA